MKNVDSSSPQDWKEAAARLEDYLESCEIPDAERRWKLALEILAEARNAAPLPEYAGKTPLQITMNLVMTRADAWFDRLAAGHSTSYPGARGRAAWFSTGANERWASSFLAENPPRELKDALSEETIVAGPSLEFNVLRRQEVDYGAMEDIGRETWEKFSWAHVLKAFVLWVVIFFAAWGAWLHFHS